MWKKGEGEGKEEEGEREERGEEKRDVKVCISGMLLYTLVHYTSLHVYIWVLTSNKWSCSNYDAVLSSPSLQPFLLASSSGPSSRGEAWYRLLAHA